jgi:hypothetical protein
MYSSISHICSFSHLHFYIASNLSCHIIIIFHVFPQLCVRRYIISDFDEHWYATSPQTGIAMVTFIFLRLNTEPTAICSPVVSSHCLRVPFSVALIQFLSRQQHHRCHGIMSTYLFVHAIQRCGECPGEMLQKFLK